MVCNRIEETVRASSYSAVPGRQVRTRQPLLISIQQTTPQPLLKNEEWRCRWFSTCHGATTLRILPDMSLFMSPIRASAPLTSVRLSVCNTPCVIPSLQRSRLPSLSFCPYHKVRPALCNDDPPDMPTFSNVVLTRAYSRTVVTPRLALCICVSTARMVG